MKFRLKLASVHLLISVIIAGLASLLVFFLWYPSPLAKALGVFHIFLMMLGIDVVLGPLLTLLVAKQGKKTLKMDLAIIGLVQLSALVYGLYNISLNRPAYITFDTTRFNVVQAKNISDNQLQQAEAPYNQLRYVQPQIVAIIPPRNAAEQSERIFTELQTGYSPSLQPKLYEPITNQAEKLKREAKPIHELTNYNDEIITQQILQQYPQANGYVPLRISDEMDMTVLINHQGEVVEIVDLRPWR